MTRKDLEQAVYEESHNGDFQFVPWSNACVINFTIQQINLALEEAAKEIEGTPYANSAGPRLIRALKIGEAK
jgi:hypothetical protein